MIKTKNMKVYFMILNIVLASVAFCYLVNSAEIAFTETFTGLPENVMPIKTPLPPETSIWAEKGFFVQADASIKSAGSAGGAGGTGGIGGYLQAGIWSDVFVLAYWAAIGYALGAIISGGKKSAAERAAISSVFGKFAASLATQILGKTSLPTLLGSAFPLLPIAIGAGIGWWIYNFKNEKKEVVEFNCRPFEAPVGGKDCEVCNEQEECSEYACKSLGQACSIVNKGTKDEKCVWVNPNDVIFPIIEVIKVNEGLTYIPDPNVRPPATGVLIKPSNADCLKAYTPLEFTISTKDKETGLGEPSQCKIDYNLTNTFDEMSYFIGGISLYDYNHTEKMSLPGPDTINKIAPEIKNDGKYTLYIKCRDANGNTDPAAYSVRFCVEKGPDTTPPKIEGFSVLSGSPIQYNKSSMYIETYLNEPSECKWSRIDKDYNNMENAMNCETNLWDVNANSQYICRTNLTGIESRKDNLFFIRCKDKPGFADSERNVNVQSTEYKIIGTRPLNIIETQPTGTIYGSTELIAAIVKVKTDNGYQNGEARCYYKNSNSTTYLEFLNTGGNEHEQRQDLPTGSYTYDLKCIDLGGNTAYNSTSFYVETDNKSPVVARVYKENEMLKAITSEDAECSYSLKDCNFEIDNGIKMASDNYRNHNTYWKTGKTFYIKCKDKYENQPDPNQCSIIAKPYMIA